MRAVGSEAAHNGEKGCVCQLRGRKHRDANAESSPQYTGVLLR